MERISSLFFCLSLVVYYIPKLLKVSKKKYIKVHILVGGISILAMIFSLVNRIGQESFLKYCGFTLIMIFIGLTGYFMKENFNKYRKLHILFTALFFIYLYATISIF